MSHCHYKVQKMQPSSISKQLKRHQPTLQCNLLKISFQLTQLNLFNYNTQSMIDAISLVFNDQFLTQNGMIMDVQNVMKIVGYSINDVVLINKVDNLIIQNAYKKQQVYLFLAIWTKYLKLERIINLFSQKTRKILIFTILNIYITHNNSTLRWFQNWTLKPQISCVLKMNQLSSQQFWTDLKNINIQQFNNFSLIFEKLLDLILKHDKQLESSIRKNLINTIVYLGNQQINYIQILIGQMLFRSNAQRSTLFYTIFNFINTINSNEVKQLQSNIHKIVYKITQNKFRSQNHQYFIRFLQNIFFSSQDTQQSYLYLQNVIKYWLLMKNCYYLAQILMNSYIMFKLNQNSQSKIVIQKQRNLIMDLIVKVCSFQQNVQNSIKIIFMSKYLHHFFQSRPYNFIQQFSYLQNQQAKDLANERQILIKGLKNIKNQQFLNVILFNKANFSIYINWNSNISIDQLVKISNNSGNQYFKKIINKVKILWELISDKVLRLNKKIQLIYSVINIKVDNKQIYVTFLQLLTILKQYSLQKKISLQKWDKNSYKIEYPSVSSRMQKNQIAITQQKDHPIFIQAKIIKLLKKHLKQGTSQEISNKIQQPIQKTTQILKKLVTKGYLLQKDEKYEYQP